jgi:D-alanyl-D-alanine dipeptidase/carboxypeptidase
MKLLTRQQSIQLERADIHQGHLILVNSDYPVRLQIEQPSLEHECVRQLTALLQSCKAMDTIFVVSGYRSIEEQRHIYDKSLLENGIEFTSSYVARPGESEHQTGLAVDVAEISRDVDFIRPAFPDHGVCARFKQHAADYGFIQRYQDGKMHLTNIACEPWHYRYVGFPHSIIMQQKGFCLEEYTEFVKSYTDQRPYRYIDHSVSTTIEIYYIPAEQGTTTIPIMNSEQSHWSGNNKDGFVVSSWSNRVGYEQGSDDRGI